MAEEATETAAPETEAAPTTEEKPAPSAIDTLVTEVSAKLESQKAERDLDYIDDGGDDFDTKTPAPEGEETIESLKARLAEEKTMRLRAENRSSARNLREKMKEEFPNANPDTVDKYVRLVASGRKSSDSVRAIFDASNRDFARGEESADTRWKTRFEELQKTAKTDAEQEVKTAWGEPSTDSPLGGSGKLTYEQYREAVKAPGLTPAQLENLMERLED